MVEAKVQFNYKAQEPDELTITKGDTITDIKMSTGGWWEGTVRGKRGMFPDNFVKVITGNESTVPMRQGGGRRCRVLFSYTPVNEDELELKENDVIEVLGEVEEGWWKGSLNNKVGVFPSNFVKEELAGDDQSGGDSLHLNDSHLGGQTIMEASKANQKSQILKKEIGEAPNAAARSPENEGPTLPPKPSKEVCKVRFSYTAVNNDELTMHVGDIITILSKHTQEAGWWKGEITGKIGVFPDNFVEVLSTEEASKLTSTASAMPSTQTSKSSQAEEQVETKKLTFPPVTTYTTHPMPANTAPKTVDSDVPDGARLSTATPAATVQTNKAGNTNEFDKVERGAMLSHPTVTRVKAPRRRPPSAVFKDSTVSVHEDDSASSNAMDNVLVNGNGPDAEASATVKPTAVPMKEFEKQAAKLSWVEELRQNQARNRKTGEPLLEKKPTVNLPLKPNDVRAPVVLSRSSQQLQPDAPPLSTPRRASPSTEAVTATVTAPSHPAAQPPVTLKKPPPEPKPSNGLPKATAVTSTQLPASDLSLKDVQEKLTKMEELLHSMQKTLLHKIEKLEEEIATERTKRVKLEKKLEKMIV